jgi:hypothetical protein
MMMIITPSEGKKEELIASSSRGLFLMKSSWKFSDFSISLLICMYEN